jgi:hypothetical protein
MAGQLSRGRPRKSITPTDQEEVLVQAAADFALWPDRWVLFIYPWGQEGTPLEKFPEGPDVWQMDFLRRLGAELRIRMAEGVDPKILVAEALASIRVATASGHGVGKSALVSWIVHWFASCFPHGRGVVTANTKTQLTTKTWAEVAKWHKLAFNEHWFTWAAESYKHKEHPETWFISAIPWSKDRPESFAGLHAEYVLVIFDEASAIADTIWEVTEGAMTTPGAMWFVFGNPTRSSGRFHACFNLKSHMAIWIPFRIDSRTARHANQNEIKRWIDTYGEDSDFCRIRIFGIFPKRSSTQFIGTDLIEAAMKGELDWTSRTLPLIMAIDVAWQGNDESVFAVRKGQNAQIAATYRGLDPTQIASLAAKFIDQQKPDAIFVDANGIGAGVYSHLLHLGYPVTAINHSARAVDEMQFFNKRTEMWGDMREWLRLGGKVANDEKLGQQLAAMEYGMSGKAQIQLESKDDMRARDLESPDRGDALAYTFYEPVAPKANIEDLVAQLQEQGSNDGTSWMAA